MHTWSKHKNGYEIAEQETFFHGYGFHKLSVSLLGAKRNHTPRKWSNFGVPFCNSEEPQIQSKNKGARQMKTVTIITTILILICSYNVFFSFLFFFAFVLVFWGWWMVWLCGMGIAENEANFTSKAKPNK